MRKVCRKMTAKEKVTLAYKKYLEERESAPATVEKYMSALESFFEWLADRRITKETVIGWKADLTQGTYSPSTVNTKIAAINGFLIFMGLVDCRLKTLKNPRPQCCAQEEELTVAELKRLEDTAKKLGNIRLFHVLETLSSTGIRVSELQYFTVEACRKGSAVIALKGKYREIVMPHSLCKKLLRYAKDQGIESGCILRTSTGRPLSRKQIWAEMKGLCQAAQVDPRKVYPHNLRHLFAVEHYRVHRNIVMLASILGHSSIETTKLYLRQTREECRKSLEELDLVS